MSTLPWKEGKCRVPMFMMGGPAGYCDRRAFGPQLPFQLLKGRGFPRQTDVPYCHGHCCPNHGGPDEGAIIVFQDGTTPQGRPLWCAVLPDFVNLQESPAGFSGDPSRAMTNLEHAIRDDEARS